MFENVSNVNDNEEKKTDPIKEDEEGNTIPVEVNWRQDPQGFVVVVLVNR